jgi:hypothetical protein
MINNVKEFLAKKKEKYGQIGYLSIFFTSKYCNVFQFF